MIVLKQPDAEYHAHSHIGSSSAKLALKSMQLFHDEQTGVYEVADKPCFQIGRLAHMAVLEPDRFAETVTIDGPVNPRTQKPFGRDTIAFYDWQLVNPHVTCIEPWLHTSLLRMPDEVKSVLSGGDTEVSVYNEINGLGVKCRPDHLRGTVISDLKTIGDVDDIRREIVRRKYWFSASWYRNVMKRETGEKHSFRLIFMEKNAPYRWRIVDLMADYVLYGDAVVTKIMEDIRLANKHQDWRDTGDVIQLMELPDFMDETENEDDE